MKLTFFDCTFFVLYAASIITIGLCPVDSSCLLPIMLLAFCMYLLGRKDLKDRWIPFRLWVIVLPPVVCGISMTDFTLLAWISLIPAAVVMVLGFFRIVNGADSFGITALMICALPIGIVKSWVLLLASFVLAAGLYSIIPEWREKKGIPYLVPLALICAVSSVVVYIW